MMDPKSIILILSCVAVRYVASESCDLPQCNSDDLLPVPWHSGQYITCRGQKGYLRQCPLNHRFDQTSKTCLPGTAAFKSCGQSQIHTILSKLAPKLEASELKLTIDQLKEDIGLSLKKDQEYSKRYSFQRSNRADNISQQCRDHSVTPVVCSEVESADGLLPHPDDCQLFYYCVSPDLPPVCRDCPAGLHFNPVKHVCDEPQDAGCTVKTPTTTERLTTTVEN